MPRVQDVATIKAVGLGMHDQETLDSRAYLVWQAAHKSGKTTPAPDGIGVHYKSDLTRVILSLWPELAPSEHHDELVSFRKEVYSFLRATNNARCIQRASRDVPVVWWLSKEWQQATGAVVLRIPVSKAYVQTHTEAKLTKKEAGEDRVPSPVETRKINDDKDEQMPTAQAEAPPKNGATKEELAERLSEHRKKIMDEHAQFLELCELSVHGASEPVTILEVAHDIGSKEKTVGDALRELVRRGRLFSRKETKEERTVRFGTVPKATPATLFWHEEKIPERKTREVVKGYVATPTVVSNPAPRGSNDARVLAATRSTFEPIGVIGVRAGVPQGSMAGSMKRLVEAGKVEARERLVGSRKRMVYRKVRSIEEKKPVTTSTTSVAAPAPAQPVVAPPPLAQTAPPAKPSTDLVFQIKQMVDQLAAQGAESDRMKQLETENQQLRDRVQELETALAPLQALLQNGRD